MSFTKTISTVAALASIFGAGAAGFKLAQDSQSVDTQNIQTKYEERITDLQQQVSDLQKQNLSAPPAINLPPQPQSKVVAPAPATLPPAPPAPPEPPAAGNFE